MQIERGKNQIHEALFSTPMALNYVVQLGAALANGEIMMREVVEKPDGDEEENEHAIRSNAVFKGRCAASPASPDLGKNRERTQARARFKAAPGSTGAKAGHTGKKDFRTGRSAHLSTTRIDELAQRMKRASEHLASVQHKQQSAGKAAQTALVAEVETIESAMGLPASEIKSLAGMIRDGEHLVTSGKKEFTEANLRLVVSVAKISQPRVGLSGPGSGGQPRFDASRRKVRLSPGVQVFDLRDLVDSTGHYAQSD